jgi:uncharacterized LabA/DUF88 family protein
VKTFAYVDGFNLYYRALKGTPYKWLNLRAFLTSILGPTYSLEAIRYYTADVSGKRDPTAHAHQQAYIRALKTLPELTIHRGSFIAKPRWAALADPPPNFLRPSPVCVWIMRTEEKGSDVNLASHLLRDAFKAEFDTAVVVTNDSDLTEPIRIVTKEFGKPVEVVCPSNPPARSLRNIASKVWHIHPSHLANSQFPTRMPGKILGRQIVRPPDW